MKNKLRTKFPALIEISQSFTAWLTPGIAVKRYIAMILLGTTLVGVGLGVIILDIYRSAPDTWWLPVLSTASLRFLPRPLRALIFGGIGFSIILLGIWALNRSIITPFLSPGRKVGDTLRMYRQRDRGPNMVAIGGGHGLSALLRGVKEYTHNITAIVTVADDGGSSGRLRRELGILPPGDIRNCLVALSRDEELLGQLFQYRFPSGETGLEGHSFGNLFITALSEITGSFENAVAESGKVLSVKGSVMPSTLHDVRLLADVVLPHSVHEMRIKGESEIPKSNGKVRRVWLEPNNPPAYPLAVKAILSADLIVIGPGSLYTSLLPNLLVPDIANAIRASRALKILVCNVATERGETDYYSCGDHLRALEEHIGDGLFEIAIVNRNYGQTLPHDVHWVEVELDLAEDFPIYEADLIDGLYPWRHDTHKLAHVIMELYQERTGPLVE
jgi:uncharacterized cofD-like protein